MNEIRKKAKRLVLALYNIDAIYYVSEKKKRLSDAELCFMYALDDGLPHSQKEIAEKWLVPKTTVNTITKRWEKEGLLSQTIIPGKRREMQITLTDAGKAYSNNILSFLYEAENEALVKTIEKYSPAFIDALEFYGAKLKDAFERQLEENSHKETHEIKEGIVDGFTQR